MDMSLNSQQLAAAAAETEDRASAAARDAAAVMSLIMKIDRNDATADDTINSCGDKPKLRRSSRQADVDTASANEIEAGAPQPITEQDTSAEDGDLLIDLPEQTNNDDVSCGGAPADHAEQEVSHVFANIHGHYKVMWICFVFLKRFLFC